jgi:formylglycine-generating enzyme required for sulfatase activity
VTLEPAGPIVDGWVESSIDGVDCAHPAVVADCYGGWCRVPAGCFIMGSPDTELWRGEATERLTAVVLTHAFEIAQFELTWQDWSKLVPLVPEKPPQVIEAPETCHEPACPLRYATWFEALAFANLLSERHTPPLPPCYDLASCNGELGRGLTCARIELTTPTPHDCRGYRLPTEAEWEYAARAGTRTAYYSGDISTADPSEEFLPEPNLAAVAWYEPTAGERTHPVGSQRPNRWTLFDMLGNVSEWTSDQVSFEADPLGPLTNPATDFGLNMQLGADNRVNKGSNAAGARSSLRSAGRNYSPSDTATQGVGFRLVRSLD